MTVKTCSKCNELKPIDDFYTSKTSKDGYISACKCCETKRLINYKRTPDGVATSILGCQRHSSKQRNHKMPCYTKAQFKEWLFSQDKFNYLYDNWVASGYKKDLRPSVDRIDDYKTYSFDNIQLMTWAENSKKAYKERKNGKNNKVSKAVVQYSLNNEFIKEYYSQSQAARELEIDRSCISYCCIGKQKTAGGYKWKYKGE